MADNAPRKLGLPVVAWVGLLIALLAGAVAYLLVGANLGLFLAGITFTALLVPPLCLAEPRLVDRLLIAGGVVDGIATVWLIAVLASPVTLLQWLLCCAILIAWGFALSACAHALALAGRHHAPASAIIVVLAMLWLSAPIWLGTHAAGVVPVHPLLSINGVLANLGLWSERPIAYRYLLNLGQDVAYDLPGSIVPMALLHLLIGSAALLLSRAWGRR